MYSRKEKPFVFFKHSKSMIVRIACINTILLLIMFLGSSIIISHYSNTLYQDTLEDTEKAVASFQEFTNRKLSNIISIFDVTTLSRDVAPILSRVNQDYSYACSTDASNRITDYLIDCSHIDSEIYDLYIIPLNSFSYHYDPPASAHSVLQNYPFFEDSPLKEFLADNSSTTLFYYNAQPGYAPISCKPVVSFATKIYHSSRTSDSQVVGVFLINYQIDTFHSFCNTFLSSDLDTLLICDSSNTILYSSSTEDIGNIVEDKYPSNEETYIVTATPINPWNLTAMGIISRTNLFKDVNNMRLSQYTIIGICLMVNIIVSWILFRYYFLRVKDLVTIMQQTSLDKRLPVSGTDELSLISSAYNNMCEQIQLWINKHYRARIQLRTAELRTLTMQINPHFIYNTLENIRMKAVINGDDQVAEMIALFGSMFRWTMHPQTPFVRVEDELMYINSYLKLQAIHFSDRLQVDIDSEDWLLDYAVPKLILQPIVENSIIHGLKDQASANKALYIRITVIAKEADLIFNIEDNGIGMSVEQMNAIIAMLNNDSPAEEDTGIGLKNVHSRLRLLFGEQYGLQIQSNIGRGTTVRVVLPKMSLEEMSKYV